MAKLLPGEASHPGTRGWSQLPEERYAASFLRPWSFARQPTLLKRRENKFVPFFAAKKGPATCAC